jgi:hypothetical protein
MAAVARYVVVVNVVEQRCRSCGFPNTLPLRLGAKTARKGYNGILIGGPIKSKLSMAPIDMGNEMIG